MSMRFLAVLPALVLTAAATAQTAIWTPPGYAAVAGNSNNAFPWNWNALPMRYVQVYGAANFTGQGANFPVLISRLRFRAALTSGGWAGGSWPNVVLNMSTAATTYTGISSTFATNHGPNLATVYTGPVTVLPGSASNPGPVYIDIALNTPFLYDPAGGDLCLEVVNSATGWSGTSTQCDAVQGAGPGGPVLARRVYNTSSSTAASGGVDGFDYGLVTEFTYVPSSGYAYASPFGTGCYDLARASFYQLFQNGAFNLANNAIQMIPGGAGYIVVPGSTQWHTPTGANLGLLDNSVSGAQPLGFTFPYPGGSTTGIYVCSNGFVWLQTNSDTGCCAPVAGNLLSGGARICPLWTDLNPGAGGTVVFDVDVPNQTAYVTWTNVPETSTTSTSTFQVAFHAGGQMDLRWQACSVLNHLSLTGWSPGGGARDPGSVNLLTAMPILTNPDLSALAFTASARPRIGTSVNLVTSNIPAGTPVGAEIFSNTQHNPGIDLASIGMPGCRQYVGLDFTNIFVVSGTSASVPLGVPNNPALAGVRVQCQSATFSSGLNALGVLASNGLTLVLDLL
jgi:hypothetical protein